MAGHDDDVTLRVLGSGTLVPSAERASVNVVRIRSAAPIRDVGKRFWSNAASIIDIFK